MATLIEQLQEEALNPETSIADLLRKAKVVASKLDLREAVEWIDQEMNGYSRAEPPDYRTVACEASYLNPFHGWSQILIGDAELDSMVRVRKLGNPASELEALMEGKGMLRIPFPPSFVATLCEMAGRDIPHASSTFGRSAVAGILDAIRNRVLDWAVELERAGVRGEGRLSFSKTDREAASHVTNNFNINAPVTGNLGSAGTSTVNVTTVPPEALAAFRRFADQVHERSAELGLGATARADFEKKVDELRAELARSTPSPSSLGVLLGSIKTVAEGAAGSLVASGMLHFLATNPTAQALIARATGS